jgi:predicted Rossmann fold flavoprotein
LKWKWRLAAFVEAEGASILDDSYEVVVIGAGAAGLVAATESANRGKKTLLLEKNRRPGVKILMSGGTRCNLTHATDKWGIVRAYGSQGNFLHSALAALSPANLVQMIEDEGVATKVEETGKIFPVSNRATDVLAALMRRLMRSGAELGPEEPVEGIARLPDSGLFRVRTRLREISAPSVVITVGGQSYPGSGTSGDGYSWAASFGHKIVPPRPALVPLSTDAEWVRGLSGITVPDVELKLFAAAPEALPAKPLDQRRGSLLFTHFGLSGPVVLDISRTFTGLEVGSQALLRCDFLPEVPGEKLEEEFRRAAAADGKRLVANLLSDRLPHRLIDSLFILAGVRGETRLGEFPKAGRTAVVNALKSQPVSITGTRGFAKAEVTAGGVALNEIDSRTMESKLVPGLYFAGEILDLDGPIGGYNFQAAFSTGVLAGQSV